jgi:hypothetical protein
LRIVGAIRSTFLNGRKDFFPTLTFRVQKGKRLMILPIAGNETYTSGTKPRLKDKDHNLSPKLSLSAHKGSRRIDRITPQHFTIRLSSPSLSLLRS